MGQNQMLRSCARVVILVVNLQKTFSEFFEFLCLGLFFWLMDCKIFQSIGIA